MRSGGLGRRVIQWKMRTRFQQNGHRRTRSHQEEFVKRHHRKGAIGEEMQTGRRRFVACSVSGCGFKSSQCSSIFRFPELVKRITLDMCKPQRSCSAYNSKQLASGLRTLLAKAPTAIGRILSPCLFPLSLAVTLHTLNNSVIISPSFKPVTNAMKVGMFRLRCSFVTG